MHRRPFKLLSILLIAAAGIAPVTSATAHDVSCANPNVPGGEWRQFRNQLGGDGVQDKEFFLNTARVPTLQPAWTFDANEVTFMNNNEITGYPVVADGCVYVGSSTGWQLPGWMFALNADSGELVWRKQVDRGIYSTLAVGHGMAYAFVSKVKVQADTQIGGPYVVAVDQFTGEEIWRTTVDFQIGSDAVSSPVLIDGMVWVGISATAAEVSEGDRGLFQGNFVLLDALTGDIVAKTYTIPEDEWETGYAGAAQWGTISIDPETLYGYESIGNPFDYEFEHERTNAVIKVDMARARDANGDPILDTPMCGTALGMDPCPNPDFAQVLGSYKGDVEAYFPGIGEAIPCEEIEEVEGFTFLGIECLRLDLDFGVQPNVFKDSTGRKLVGAGQKSGVFHVFDADTMEPVWTQLLGFPSPVGGIVGSAAYDGNNLIGPHTIGGYIWSIEKNAGGINWVQPTLDGVHWGPPMTVANGVAYTVDLAGFLDAWDSQTGAPLLKMPMKFGTDTHEDPTFSWGGVTVARNTVYASVGVGLASLEQPLLLMPNGFVIAYRPTSVTP